MNPVQFIRTKRLGLTHSQEELTAFLQAYLHDQIEDYQMSAWLMAALLNGMNQQETRCMTQTMLNSGNKMDLSDIDAPKADKHSTGGVGDKLSLVLAPIAAACGLCVPMISGRGLGHTGGTLDKMESVPGFTVRMDSARFKSLLKKHNLAMAGQSDDIAPLDKRLYALRDVTATVEFIPFIAASIMSKKLSEDLDALVLDVKVGSGAFMEKEDQAIELAKTLVGIGQDFGVKTTALITDMDQPLGTTIGNWLEMKEALDLLNGHGPEDSRYLSLALSAQMLFDAGMASNLDAALAMATECLDSGKALEKWIEVAVDQGADAQYLEGKKVPKTANTMLSIEAPKDAFLQAVDSRALGTLATELGAGRLRKEDDIDPAAGIELFVKKGQKLQKGQLIGKIHTNKTNDSNDLLQRFMQCITFSDQAVTSTTLIRYKIDQHEVTRY